ncbi:hypothetical protein M427DRAFT_34741 [Gonapodya prolifera JEL478]|uniref:Uncharacterized protein n=1 Tax=Gonapodya prolifera (strain JEL478) TaxID=1344416 RepID=A0A139A706_GONPJ|nr:hypothetical protein M427DRAFT_34741 [Gonapodya prolifera JEL478]|eukprot:KXS12561.1 hypothetical protein M427DRAFT_34741 [Gonapodya prolifera JEL478]
MLCFADIIVLVVTFIIVTFAYGFFSLPGALPFAPNLETLAKNPSSYTWTKALYAVVFVICECVVAASALLYCIFLVPFYAKLDTTGQVLWTLLIHPVYFELIVFVPLRALTDRHMKKRIGVMPVLVLAHAQIHKVVSGMMLLTSIPTFNAMVIGTIGVAIFRFFWRTSTFYRGALVDKVVERWLGTHVEPIRSRQASIRSPSSRQATSNALGKVPSALMDDEDVVIIEDRYEASKFLLATELSYEIILEIATVFFAPICKIGWL